MLDGRLSSPGRFHGWWGLSGSHSELSAGDEDNIETPNTALGSGEGAMVAAPLTGIGECSSSKGSPCTEISCPSSPSLARSAGPYDVIANGEEPMGRVVLDDTFNPPEVEDALDAGDTGV
jgi:hypothetical protein